MDTAAQPILDLLSEAERKRDAALERSERAKIEADKFSAEAAAYRRALAAIGFRGESGTEYAAAPSSLKKPRKPRAPSSKWIEIYTSLYLSADVPYDYPAIIEAASEAGHEITDGAVRTQMMNAVNSGIFERLDAGKFRFTERGLEAIDASPNKNSDAAASEEAKAGEATTLPGLHNPQPVPPGTQD